MHVTIGTLEKYFLMNKMFKIDAVHKNHADNITIHKEGNMK